MEESLKERSGNKCELTGKKENLTVFQIPDLEPSTDHSIYICESAKEQIESNDFQSNFWHGLNESAWSEHKAVQIMVYRILSQLNKSWATDLLDILHFNDDTLTKAKAGLVDESNTLVHKDINGVTLQTGDSIILVKDLKVKGSSLIAKQGTAIRKISLDRNNEEYIEGKVNGQQIVILTKYVKKI